MTESETMEMYDRAESERRKQRVMELTSYLLHKYYCENDVESIISLFDDRFSWFGAGEDEAAVDPQRVAEIFRQFAGMIPKCNISEENYYVVEQAPDAFLCSGRMWIVTDPSAHMYLRVHQRVTTAFRWVDGDARCCHIHISNPYTEMSEGDVGFPTHMGQQSYQYLQEQIEQQKRQIEDYTALLERMSFEDTLTKLYNRNRFYHMADHYQPTEGRPLAIACFDLNGLK